MLRIFFDKNNLKTLEKMTKLTKKNWITLSKVIMLVILITGSLISFSLEYSWKGINAFIIFWMIAGPIFYFYRKVWMKIIIAADKYL